MEKTRYRGFRIVAHPYQLHECRQWAADLEIRRGGLAKPFGVGDRFASEAEALRACTGLGRRIIDGRVPGWSVDRLGGPSGGWWPFNRFNGELMRRSLVFGLVVLGLGAFLLFRGASFTSSRDVLNVGDIKVTAEERQSIPPWAGGVVMAIGAGLMIAGARKRA